MLLDHESHQQALDDSSRTTTSDAPCTIDALNLFKEASAKGYLTASDPDLVIDEKTNKGQIKFPDGSACSLTIVSETNKK